MKKHNKTMNLFSGNLKFFFKTDLIPYFINQTAEQALLFCLLACHHHHPMQHRMINH
jgi:hypothetical protein